MVLKQRDWTNLGDNWNCVAGAVRAADPRTDAMPVQGGKRMEQLADGVQRQRFGALPALRRKGAFTNPLCPKNQHRTQKNLPLKKMCCWQRSQTWCCLPPCTMMRGWHDVNGCEWDSNEGGGIQSSRDRNMESWFHGFCWSAHLAETSRQSIQGKKEKNNGLTAKMDFLRLRSNSIAQSARQRGENWCSLKGDGQEEGFVAAWPKFCGLVIRHAGIWILTQCLR